MLLRVIDWSWDYTSHEKNNNSSHFFQICYNICLYKFVFCNNIKFIMNQQYKWKSTRAFGSGKSNTIRYFIISRMLESMYYYYTRVL